mmetsp:Transcript_15783/g.25212  ORF Transcript_15783/g.25212 Transcript_15783/m.25212 type:complete len:207 (+) Transcript_15783:415-1035(+)
MSWGTGPQRGQRGSPVDRPCVPAIPSLSPASAQCGLPCRAWHILPSAGPAPQHDEETKGLAHSAPPSPQHTHTALRLKPRLPPLRKDWVGYAARYATRPPAHRALGSSASGVRRARFAVSVPLVVATRVCTYRVTTPTPPCASPGLSKHEDRCFFWFFPTIPFMVRSVAFGDCVLIVVKVLHQGGPEEDAEFCLHIVFSCPVVSGA